jgi:hypothetical protein
MIERLRSTASHTAPQILQPEFVEATKTENEQPVARHVGLVDAENAGGGHRLSLD